VKSTTNSSRHPRTKNNALRFQTPQDDKVPTLVLARGRRSAASLPIRVAARYLAYFTNSAKARIIETIGHAETATMMAKNRASKT
jgi:hypothetical protein